jgi:hypothetical protein
MTSCKVIDLNNSAVASLQQGSHKQAIALLRTAIAEIKNHCVVHKQQATRVSSSSETVNSESSVEMHAGADSSSAIKVNQKQDKPAILSVPLWTDTSFEQKDDKTLIFMYAQALVLADVDHRKETLIAVVLYNMALANHALAIASNISKLLAVALKFYGMAVAVLQGQNGDADNTSFYWLLVALHNNMAQIYLSQACSEKLRFCLGNIRSLLFEAHRIGQIIPCDDYAFFLTNAKIQISVVAAPAA